MTRWLLTPFCLMLLFVACRPRQAVDSVGGPSDVSISSITTASPNVTTVEPAVTPDIAEADNLASEILAAAPIATNKDELLDITFDDLKIEMEADMAFEESMLTDRVRELDGRRVRIRGFIFPGVFQQRGLQNFAMVMNTQCKFGPGGQAHHVIMIELVKGVTTDYTIRPIAIQGRLKVKPLNGPDENTWALYHMVGEKVE